MFTGKRCAIRYRWVLDCQSTRSPIDGEDDVIADNSMDEKPYTDQTDIVCRRYDHAQQRYVEGINLAPCLYHRQGVSLPVEVELVRTTARFTDPPIAKAKQCSDQTKNDMDRDSRSIAT